MIGIAKKSKLRVTKVKEDGVSVVKSWALEEIKSLELKEVIEPTLD